MRSLLLLSSLLFLTACGDSTEPATSTQQKEKPAAQQTKKAPIKKEVTKPAVQAKKSPSSGHSIYAHKCASCHGLKAEKMALNKSKVIAGWDAEKTTEILKGYQDGSYGGSMKGIMKGQVSTLDEKEIALLSLYISTL